MFFHTATALPMCQKVNPLITRQGLVYSAAASVRGGSTKWSRNMRGSLRSTEENLSKTQNCPWWHALGQTAITNGSAIIDSQYCGSNCCTVTGAAQLEEVFQPSVGPDGGHGFPGSSDFATGCVGLTDWRLVCGPPSEHLLQLFSPLPLDISSGLPFSAIHGKKRSQQVVMSDWVHGIWAKILICEFELIWAKSLL